MRGNKKEQIEKRVISEAIYFSSNKSTVRETAKHFGISKTTVHRDLMYRLPEISYELYREVDGLIKENLEERHNRGGEATKMKYQRI